MTNSALTKSEAKTVNTRLELLREELPRDTEELSQVELLQLRQVELEIQRNESLLSNGWPQN